MLSTFAKYLSSFSSPQQRLVSACPPAPRMGKRALHQILSESTDLDDPARNFINRAISLMPERPFDARSLNERFLAVIFHDTLHYQLLDVAIRSQVDAFAFDLGKQLKERCCSIRVHFMTHRFDWENAPLRACTQLLEVYAQPILANCPDTDVLTFLDFLLSKLPWDRVQRPDIMSWVRVLESPLYSARSDSFKLSYLKKLTIPLLRRSAGDYSKMSYAEQRLVWYCWSAARRSLQSKKSLILFQRHLIKQSKQTMPFR